MIGETVLVDISSSSFTGSSSSSVKLGKSSGRVALSQIRRRILLGSCAKGIANSLENNCIFWGVIISLFVIVGL